MTDIEFVIGLPSQITSERIIFKKTTLSDADALFSIWSDEAVAKFMNIEKFTTISQAQEMIQLINEEPSACRYTLFINGKIAGSLGINDIDPNNKTVEIGYELAKSFWRQGFMTEALHTFIKLLKQQNYLTGVSAKVLPDNIASIELLKKMNFTCQTASKEFELHTQAICTVFIFSLSF